MNAEEAKTEVRARDKRACRKCGMTERQHRRKYGVDLDVHRLLPGSDYVPFWCVTLCKTCHGPMPERHHNIIFGEPENSGIGLVIFNLFDEGHKAVWDKLSAIADSKDEEIEFVAIDALRHYVGLDAHDWSI